MKDGKFQHYGGLLKNPIFREEFPRKGGELGQFSDLRWGLLKKRGVVFLRGGGYTPIHAMVQQKFFVNAP